MMYSEVEYDLRALAEFHSCDVPSTVWTSLIKIIKVSLLPCQSFGEDRPPEEGDFTEFKKNVVRGAMVISDFINKIITCQPSQSLDRDSVLWMLIFCGEHSSDDLWTNEEIHNFSKSCVKALCSFYGCASVSDLLLGQTDRSFSPCLKQVFLMLRPKLLKETWCQNPAAVSAYKWFLMQIRSPNLSEYLAIVSPTALLIIDDHDLGRRLIGLCCMSHIIDNVARTELCQLGLQQVFYKALEHLLWQRVADQVEPVVTCLRKLLSKTERGYTRQAEPGMWDLFDDTLKTILEKMTFEDQISLRLAYVKSLGPFILAMGSSVIRWSKLLLSVLDEYLHKESYDTRRHALEVLQIFLEISSPRLHKNGDFVLFLLLRTIQDVSTEVEEHRCTEPELLKMTASCIKSIKNAAPSEFEKISQDLKDLECNLVMKTLLLECINDK